MSGLSRHILLANQSPSFTQTGLDFLSVNPANHRELQVYFVISPDQLSAAPTSADEFNVRIRSQSTGREIPILSQNFTALGAPESHTILTILCREEGGFEYYSLEIQDLIAARIDPFLNSLQFSFKQSCPSRFDCADELDCNTPVPNEFRPDYLARDFESYRRLFFEYAAQNYPNWQINNPADQSVMTAELLAAIGDEMALMQDQYFLEGQWGQLTQKRSFNALAQLIDYQLRPEQGSSGYAIFRHYIGRTQPSGASVAADVPAGARIWGQSESGAFIPFETGNTLQDILDNVTYQTRSDWTDLNVYPPFDDCTCIDAGTDEIYVLNHISHPELLFANTPILIEARGKNSFEPPVSVIVRLREPPIPTTDFLNNNTDITLLRFQPPLPFAMDISNAFVSANLLPIQSGETHEIRFQIGQMHADIPSTIERNGPQSNNPCDVRPVVHRFPLHSTVEDGLSWRFDGNIPSGTLIYDPEVILHEETVDGSFIATWTSSAHGLEFQATDERVAIEHGIYGHVYRYYENGAYHNFQDYQGDAGYTIRFGNGEFGIEPDEGSIFRAFFRTSFSVDANLPAGSVKHISIDASIGISTSQANLPNEIQSVENPLALSGASQSEPIDIAREIAPHAYHSLRFYAVRDEDYAEAATRLDCVQSSIAHSRWTGMWNAVFTGLDMYARDEISQITCRDEVRTHLDIMRQAGREVHINRAQSLPFHLDIAICTRAGFVIENVSKAISAQLSGKNEHGFFHPDAWRYGSEILRAELERKIAGVAGVGKIVALRYALGYPANFLPFTSERLVPPPDQIFQLQNDPTQPERGSIRIYEGAFPEVLT